MIIKSAEFLVSNTQISKLPPATMPEFAFIGRSNVGKSSLINMLVAKKGLAKTSQTPGKTQLINHFEINKNWYLVDLPGYGYARASKTSIAKWEKFIRHYLNKRENLQCVMVLIDSRLPPQKVDIEFIASLGTAGLPFVIVFTKADKQSNSKTAANVQLFHTELLKSWEELPPSFVSSAEDGRGRKEILDFIELVNANYVQPELYGDSDDEDEGF